MISLPRVVMLVYFGDRALYAHPCAGSVASDARRYLTKFLKAFATATDAIRDVSKPSMSSLTREAADRAWLITFRSSLMLMPVLPKRRALVSSPPKPCQLMP